MILAEDLKRAVNIVDLIGTHTKLRRPGPSGRSWRGPCPLHNGEDPNLAVYEDTQSFCCFVCKKSGDVYDYLQLSQGISFREAYRRLAGANGLDVDVRGTHFQQPPQLRLSSGEVKAFDKWLWLKREWLFSKLRSVQHREKAAMTFAETCFKSPNKIPERELQAFQDNLIYAHAAREVIEQQLDRIDFRPTEFDDDLETPMAALVQVFIREFYADRNLKELLIA